MERVATILRKGAIVDVPSAASHPCHLSGVIYADIRFPGGRVERWVGPGREDLLRPELEAVEQAVEFGSSLVLEQSDCLLEEVTGALPEIDHTSFQDLPLEVVVRWL